MVVLMGAGGPIADDLAHGRSDRADSKDECEDQTAHDTEHNTGPAAHCQKARTYCFGEG